MSDMCMSVAPASVAFCVPPPPKGEIYRTPFCHMPKGHDGPCWGMGFKWLAQQPPQPLDRVQEPASHADGLASRGSLIGHHAREAFNEADAGLW